MVPASQYTTSHGTNQSSALLVTDSENLNEGKVYKAFNSRGQTKIRYVTKGNAQEQHLQMSASD